MAYNHNKESPIPPTTNRPTAASAARQAAHRIIVTDQASQSAYRLHSQSQSPKSPETLRQTEQQLRMSSHTKQSRL